MIKALLTFAVACAVGTASQVGYKEHTIDGHRVHVTNVEKTSRKWMIFPDQKRIHKDISTNFRDSEIPTIHSKDLVQLDDQFWSKHAGLLNLGKDTVMVPMKSWKTKGTKVTHQKFHQTRYGVRVIGGEFIVTTGAHGGVLRVNGMSIGAELAASDIEKATDAAITQENVIISLENYITHRMEKKQFPSVPSARVELVAPIEMVWHNSLFAVAKEGKMTLAYYVDGRVGSSSAEIIGFDAFVNAHTGEVLQFLDKSQQGETSPFSSPIENATIYVYDQWRKDLNDDKADYYYSQDPDRYSNLTLVFDTNEPGYVYPTTDYEMNELIDNTLYIKYMYYSLSGGEYLTWNLTETDLNIEYNLSIANAYFDGYWGIHFGTGYITDDVVPHEWSHGYTQTGCGLIYAYESGAMNEAFSDIYGESIDILNYDTTDPDVHRTPWPTSCHMTLNTPTIPPGNDFGTRWSMGENVTTSYPNGDGSIRDMYKPECYFHPSTTVADYYSCTTYADSGGVHKNSGVLNRLYAVLTDGGFYQNPANPTDPNDLLQVDALGWTKATNLFWRTHQVLTPTSQYIDFAMSIKEVCFENINAVLYVPNLFNYTIIESNEVLTDSDCDNVVIAVIGSGMDNAVTDFCPNIVCDPNNQYDCEWGNCSETNTQLFYEDYDYYMGYGLSGQLSAICAKEDMTSKYARVFEQGSLDDLTVSCIQFGFFMNGQTQVTLGLYVDSTGGNPDWASMKLISSINVTTINAVGQFQVQTATFPSDVPIEFPNDDATLVVVLSTPPMSEGTIVAGGSSNGDVVNTVGVTYVGGDCWEDGFTAYYDYANDHGMSSTASNQWFVKVSGTSDIDTDTDNEDDDNNKLSDGAIAGIVIGAVVGGIVLGVLGFFVFRKYIAGSSKSEALLG